MEILFKKSAFLGVLFFLASQAIMAQINPIIDLVNTPNNDIDGQVVVCANDGSQLPHIFLCGANDMANLAVSYPGSTIEWQLLDDNSCTNFGDNCTNQSQGCSYTTVATGNNFPVGQDGKYRLRVNLGNGVFENHYFHVYQNDLDLLYQKADIGCEPFGNITITNLGSLYGFQLINADNDQVLMPFSANNGPSFLIPGNGNYRIEATQLDGVNGNPIPNACLFSTPSIPIGISNFSVSATSTEADCSGVATITANLANGSPDYTYELRLNDGLDGGRGTLVQVVTGENSDTYTFTGVGQGEYSVVGINSDGCEQSDIVTVAVDASNTLAFEARVSQHITCKEGNILVDPDGGKPPYRYAIWQYIDETDNLITSYNSPSEIPASEFQTSEIFDILTPGNYTFVLIDRFDCFTVSNSVDIEFVPPAEFASPTIIDQTCFGEATGSIQMNLIDDNGYQLTYYLFDEVIPQQDVFDGTFNINDAIATNLSGFFPGLMQGDYTIIINMRKGSADCDYPYYYTVDGPALALAGEAILIQPYSCVQTGTIRANNYGGGVSPYEFSLDGANWQTDDMFIGLVPGSYTILVRDALGCVVETNPVDILDVDGPTDLVFAPTQITCDSPGSDVTVTVVGGAGPFDVQITSPVIQGATSISDDVALFENLVPGTYMFNVTDASDCAYSESFTILPITPIGVDGQPISNLSCLGADDGSLNYTVDGFDPTFSYDITNSGGTLVDAGTAVAANVISLNNLPQDTYTITVTDDVTTCTATASVTIEAPATLLTATLNVADLTCSATGTNPGSIAVNATGGWGSYQYELTDPSNTTTAPQSSNVFNNLTDTTGTYTVTVTDAGGCVFSESFSLNPITPPLLEVTANSPCYDDATGLTLTAAITSGGDGNFLYQLNNGGYTNNNVFGGLGPGTYTIDVVDGRNCTDSQTITVNPQMDVSATVQQIAACESSTDVLITAFGGDGNFVYAVVPSGSSPSTGDFGASNVITIAAAGNYDVYVRDNAGNNEYCEATDTVTVVQDPVLDMVVTIDPQVIPCSGSSDGSITIAASGGSAPYLYSVDGGTNFQPGNVFVNLSSGDYTVVVQDSNGCERSEVHNIPETFTLSASAAVTQSPTCNPDLGTEVRILNAQGGTAPYEYSFDGGNVFDTPNSAFLLPGTHLLVLRDANGCTFDMTVTIDPAPENPTFTYDITYDCTGDGTVAVTPSSTDFNYTYILDGMGNTPAGSNVFANVSPGFHTVTVDYLPTTPLAPSILLSESFGTGANTAIAEVDPVYCYEPQNGTDNGCPHANAINRINDGEYSVTQAITSPFGAWISPNDHTGDANGRYLAMNVGNVAGTLGIIYAKRNITVVANRDINISLWAMNLLRQGTSGGDPNILIELVDGLGNQIASTTTGNIPKNNSADDWRNYTVTLNPGANTTLDIVIRTFSTVTNGNDIAVDDIQATQAAEDCPQQETFQVYVEEGQALEAAITAQINPFCVGDNTGSITFSVENFDPAAGYVYSTDGGSTYSATQTASTVSLNNLTAGTYNILIQDATNAACSTLVSATLTDPAPIVADAAITQEMSCINMTAIITANASGGTPVYEYQLESSAGAIVTAYQSGNIFAVSTAGDYNIRVRDANGCEDIIDAALPVTPPETVIFDVVATNCYSGNNDAAIQINVTDGNGNYQFQINNGPWLTPSPSSATSYTFGSLPAGNYTVNVKDGLGCEGIAVPATINPALTALVDVTPISSCADGAISVTAYGGDGNYVYAFVSSGDNPSGAFGPGNSYTVSAANSGDYDVYVRDNAGNNPYCEYLQSVTLDAPELLAFIATPQDPQCNGENGNITVNITSGQRPYDLELRDLDNGGVVIASYTDQLQATRTFYNVPPGNYEVVVTDGYGCALNQAPVVINDPDPLTADIDPILPTNCDDPDALNYGFLFINYPTTLDGTLEFSDDGGQTWSANDTFLGHISGSSVFPSIRTVDALGNTLCRVDFPRYIIPYPLDELNITVLPQIANCVELQVQVQGSEGDPPYEYTYSDSPVSFDPSTATWDGPFAASYIHQYIGLIPGRTYVFYVRDDAGCIRQSSVNVNDLVNNPFDITGAFEPSCFGANDGSIDFSIVNNSGTVYPQMHWEFYDINTGAIIQQSPGNVAWTSTLSFSGLPPSEYYVVVTGVDAGNTDQCLSASENQLIIEQLPISANLSAENMTCEAPGNIFVTNINGGGGSFTFNVDGPAGFTSIVGTADNPIAISSGSPTGTYTVTVTDQYGCDFVGTVDLTLPANPTIDNIAIDNCADPTTVTVTASGPSVDFVYSIDGGTTYVDNGGVFTNVGSGNYDIMVRDGNGCTATQSIIVHPVLQAFAELTKLLDCTVNPEAEITIEVLSGSGNYDIAINDGAIDVVPRNGLATNSYVFSTPNAGTYTITIWDNETDPECFRELVKVVPALVEPAFTPTPVDVTCFGGTDGAIIVNEMDLGIGPVIYTLSPAVDPYNVSTGRFENLPAGVYSITATAANGCATPINNIIVGQPNEILVPIPTVDPFGCTAGNNPNNASIMVDVAGITGGSGTYLVYEFINDDAATVVQRGSLATYIETNLAGGNYTINVYDDNGCIGTTTAVIPAYDELLDLTISVAPVTCVPGNDGALTVSVNSTLGDATQFEYSIDNGGSYQPSNIFNGLSAGNYLITVRHIETQCIITENAAIEEPNTFAIEFDVVQNVVCYGTDTGEVTLTFTDDTYLGDFNYTVYDTNGTPANETDDISVETGTETVNTTTAAILLGAGTYRVEATQVSAPTCTQETIFSVGTPSEAISGLARTTDITCNPGADGIIEIYNVIGGWGDYSYYVGNTPPAGAGSFVPTFRFENLIAGTYQAWVRDANGCEQLIDDNLVLEDPDPITATLQLNAENCEGASGEIEVVGVAGGQESNYGYQLIRNGVNLGPPQTSSVFSGLADGSYEVRVFDQWGCEVIVGPEVLYTPMVPTYDVVQAINCDADGEITILVTGGSGNFEYQLAHPDGGTITNNTGIFTGLTHSGPDPANYVFTVVDLDTTPQCTRPVTVSLDKPTAVTIESIEHTNLSCPGADDGTITINLEATAVGINDDPIYTFTVQNTTTGGAAITQDSPVFNNLEAGVYDITVTSGRACVATDQREITPPTPLDAAITNVVPFACDVDNAVQMAQIEVTITSGTGTPDYFYSVNNGAFLPTGGEVFVYTANAAGDYDIVIRDTNGCLFPLPTQTIEPLPQIVLDLTIGPADCPTGQEITVTSAGHSTAPATDLTFELLETGDVRPNLTTDNQVFNITEPGIYTIRVTDNITGCYEIINYEVDPKPQYSVALSAVTPISCFGDTDGTLEVTFAGYAGTYDYEVFNEDGTSAGISANNSNAHPLLITNVPAGNYFVLVTPLDYPYCDPEETLVQTVASPTEMLDALIEDLMAAGCPDNLGEISVVPEGGYLPYDITLTHSGGQQYTANDVNAHVFTGLPSGSYTVEVLDAEGCVWNGAANVAPTPAIMASGVGTAPICYDNPDGTIVVTASGGSGSYNYFINYYDETGTIIEFTPSIPQLSNEFNFLGEGYYSVTVVDNLGCADTTGIIHLDGPDQLLAELELTTAMTCVDDAVVTLTATGGTAPYEYFNPDTSVWESFNSGSQHVYNVTEGRHYATIRDVNNCQSITQVPVIINPIPDVDLIIEYASASVNCADAMTASIYAYAVGGIGNYTFDLLLNGNLVTSVTDPRNVVFENLSPGNYTVIATSEGGCNPDQEPVIIDNPEPLIFTYEADNVSCNGNEDGAITLMLSGGGGGYQYAISPNLDQFFDEDPEQGLPAGYYRFEDLAPGTYTVIVQDANECFYVEDIEIIDPEPLSITAGAIEPVVCSGEANGSITISIEGGTAPYRTAFNSNAVDDFVGLGDNPTFDGLAEGTYAIFVRDANDCEDVIILEVDGGVNLNAIVEPIYECDGIIPDNYVNITMEDPTVLGSVMYALDSTDPADMQLNPDFRNSSPGSHFIAISHANGCLQTIDFEIQSFEPLTLTLEQNNLNEITAIATGGLEDYTFYFNDDNNGTDNTYYITMTGTYTVTVIDENGCEVSAQIFMEFIDIEIPNFFTPDGDGMNDYWIPENIEGYPEILIKIYDRYGRVVAEETIVPNGWDGLYHGNELPTGDYWYVIKLNGERDEREFVGHFTLYR